MWYSNDAELKALIEYGDSFNAEQEQAMQRYKAEEKKREKWRKALAKAVERILENPNENWYVKKEMFNGYGIMICSDNGRHFVGRRYKACKWVERKRVYEDRWDFLEIENRADMMDMIYRRFNIQEEKWVFSGASWYDELDY